VKDKVRLHKNKSAKGRETRARNCYEESGVAASLYANQGPAQRSLGAERTKYCDNGGGAENATCQPEAHAYHVADAHR
jgi:hypothetical protein